MGIEALNGLIFIRSGIRIILFIIIFIFTNITFSLNGADNTIDDLKKKHPSIMDKDYAPDENLKRLPLTFDIGGNISTTSRLAFTSFEILPAGGFSPIPPDQWVADLTFKLWGRMTIEQNRYFHLGLIGLAKAENNSVVILFNINELYFNWNYNIGKIVIGRTNYNLRAATIFNGPLDGLEMDINIPYFNFKSFVGFTGLLGVFNPWFNPYDITSHDRAFVEESNLLFAYMIIKLNSEQARRIFFATDFDINFFGQHLNPYFLLQYDLGSLFNNMNTDNDLNTYHVGLNLEGRIIQNLYYHINLAGLFGSHPSSTTGETRPIVSCGLESNLRYTAVPAGYSTFILGYALGFGNSEPKGTWSDYPSDASKGFWSDRYDGEYQKKFYYYGRFDGGYVLNPILSNIHSISFKYLVSPINKAAFQLTLYAAFYQTLKLWPTGPISDDNCDLEDYIVGSEIDSGIAANLGPHFNLGIDFGIFIPETAYSDKTLRFKMGATFGFTF